MSELPKGWAETKLGEVLSLNYGKSLPASTRDGGDFAVFGSNGIVGRHSQAITEAPAIIVGRKGSFGEVHFSDAPCFPIDTTYYVDSFETLNARFAFHLLRHLPLTEMNRASAIPGLNREDAYGLEITFPPLPEQGRIVAKVDGLTARTARARKELDRIPTLIAHYKQRLLALAFAGELTAAWRKRNNDLVKNWGADISNRISLPAGWPFVFVDEIGTVGLGRQRSPKNHDGPQMRPYLRSANITWSGLDLTDVKEMNFDAADFKKFELKYGDVLINEGSGSAKEVGKPAIWRGEIPGCCFQNTLLRVQPRLCSSEYLYWFFYYTAISEGFVDSTKGMNIQHIGKFGLSSFMVPLPCKEEQAEVVRRIESAFGWLDRMAADHAAAARLLPKLDAAILVKAFQGKLVPQDPNDEPAAKLLERIKAERETADAQPKGGRGRPRTQVIRPALVDSDTEVFLPTIEVHKSIKPRKSAMTKSRQDDDVKDKPYLAGLLKSGRFSDAQSLFRAADLPVADFYKQLAWEIDNGHILDNAEELKAA